MKKFRLFIPLLILSMFILCACGSNDNDSEGTNGKIEFEEANILSIEKISIDNDEKTFLKITNNSKITVHDISIHYNIYNSEGELITTNEQMGYVDYLLEPGKFAYQEMYGIDMDSDKIKIETIDSIDVLNYSFISEGYEYTVDTQIRSAEKMKIRKEEANTDEIDILSFDSFTANTIQGMEDIRFEGVFSIKNNGKEPVTDFSCDLAYLDDKGNIILEEAGFSGTSFSSFEAFINNEEEESIIIKPNGTVPGYSTAYLTPSMSPLISKCVIYQYSYAIDGDNDSYYIVDLLNNTQQNLRKHKCFEFDIIQ